MKRTSVLIFILLVLLMLAACGAQDTATTTEADVQETTEAQASTEAASDTSAVVDNRTTEESSTDESSQPVVTAVSDEDFAKEAYMYETRSGSTIYFLVVTNNSNATVAIGANGIAKDASGNMIGADDLEIDVLGPGEQSIDYFYFDHVSGVASVDYDINYSTSSYYEPVLSDLDLQYTINNQNVVVSVTNNGDKTAKYVKAYALFFDASGNLVDGDYGYVTDNDSEIKPGKTIVEQIDTNTGFDTVKVFLTGRH